MPGIGELMDGAVQHAAQPGRQGGMESVMSAGIGAGERAASIIAGGKAITRKLPS